MQHSKPQRKSYKLMWMNYEQLAQCRMLEPHVAS